MNSSDSKSEEFFGNGQLHFARQCRHCRSAGTVAERLVRGTHKKSDLGRFFYAEQLAMLLLFVSCEGFADDSASAIGVGPALDLDPFAHF